MPPFSLTRIKLLAPLDVVGLAEESLHAFEQDDAVFDSVGFGFTNADAQVGIGAGIGIDVVLRAGLRLRRQAVERRVGPAIVRLYRSAGIDDDRGARGLEAGVVDFRRP